jgi:hypothetical protein
MNITAAIAADCLSAKGIAKKMEIDATSEALRAIETACWVEVGKGALVAIDRRDEKHGGLFFQNA